MRKFWKKKKKEETFVEEEIIPAEYRIREVKFDDNRTEFFSEARFGKWGKEWVNCGGSYYIAFSKGFDTIEEAQSAIDKRKMRDRNPSGIIEEKIHTI